MQKTPQQRHSESHSEKQNEQALADDWAGKWMAAQANRERAWTRKNPTAYVGTAEAGASTRWGVVT